MPERLRIIGLSVCGESCQTNKDAESTSQKRRYSREVKRARLAFAKKVNKMSAAVLREQLSFAMDGIVITNATSRPNGPRELLQCWG